MRRSLLSGCATFGVILALAASALGAAGGDHESSNGRVTCAHSAVRATTTVRVHPQDLTLGLPHQIADDLGRLVIPGEVSLQRRGDAIAVLRGDNTGGPPVRCDGGPTTLTGTDLMRVQSTDGKTPPNLYLDVRYGPFAPGATPEVDGSSEIEVQLREDGGLTYVRGAREPDVFRASVSEDLSALSLAGTDPISDAWVTAPGIEVFALDAGGSDDQIVIDPPARRQNRSLSYTEARAVTRSSAAPEWTSSGEGPGPT